MQARVYCTLCALLVLCSFEHAWSQELSSDSQAVKLRETTGIGFDFHFGLGSASYDDSAASFQEHLAQHSYPLGMQLIFKQFIGTIAFHEQVDFTWDSYGDRSEESAGSLGRFSRSIRLLTGVGLQFGRRAQVEPMVGLGWTSVKAEAVPAFRESQLYFGPVVGAEMLLNVNSTNGIRALFAHGFYDDPLNILTLQLGHLELPDAQTSQLFYGIGFRLATYAGNIRELIIVLGFGGADN